MTPVASPATPGPNPPRASVQDTAAASWARTAWAVVRVIELRLRFIALMAATGLVFGDWDTIVNHVDKWNRPRGARRPAAPPSEYYCPMHPSVLGEDPAQCPSCGMPLSRRLRGSGVTLPEGVLSQVRLEPGQVAQAGIRTAEVRFENLPERLAAVGFVGFDASRRALIASDGRGRLRVDRLHVNSAGEAVRAGQRLADLYGYDVAQAIRVFLEAHRARQRAPGDATDAGRTPLGDPEERVRLAVEALKVLGVRQEQIDAIAADPAPGDLLPLLAPIDGDLIKTDAVRGQYVSEGEVLFEVADLSRVWVEARVFGDDLGRVELGRPAEATVSTYPGVVFAGEVTLIAPALDPATRTAAVRLTIDNPDHRLRPGMYADVTLCVPSGDPTSRAVSTCPVTGRRLGSMGPALRVDIGGRAVQVCCSGCIPRLQARPDRFLGPPDNPGGDRVLSVPESAVIDTGALRLVYVERRPGVFDGRAVTLGRRRGDFYPVIEGLAPGERVAVAGAFLIDAETRLRPTTR